MYFISRPSPAVPAGTAAEIALTDCVQGRERVRVEALARSGWEQQQALRWESALKIYTEAWTLLETLDPQQHWTLVAPIKNNMASVLRELGRHREAEACYIVAINLLEARGEEARRELAQLYANLAALYQAVGFSDAAMRMQEKCVAWLELPPPATAAELQAALRRLALMCERSGQPEAARSAVEKVRELAA